MAMIKCSECGKEISEKANTCPNCGAPVNNQIAKEQSPTIVVSNAIPAKKKGSCLKTILIAFGILVLLGVIGSMAGNDGKSDNDSKIESVDSSNNETIKSEEYKDTDNEYVSQQVAEETEEEQILTEEQTISEEEFKAQCNDLDYKSFMRNPDDYIGQKVKIQVKVYQACKGGIFSSADTYFKTFTNDEYGNWFGDMIWIMDYRNPESESYTKILEDDIVTVYGVFNGLGESKNALDGSKSEDMKIDMIYAEVNEE